MGRAMINKPPFTYVVESSKLGEFPTDMLRRDDAQPATPADAALIEALTFGNPAKDKLPKRVQVTLTTTSRFAPNVERWESFGWRVVETNNPYTVLSRDPAEDADVQRRRLINVVTIAVQRASIRYSDQNPRLVARDKVQTLTAEGLREALECATRDLEHRQEALGFCKGIARALEDYQFAGAEDFREALNCARLLLACKDIGMVKSMVEQVSLAAASLNTLEPVAA